jgi:TPR repeat protein
MYELGILYGGAHDRAKARQWFQKAADAGNMNAMVKVGADYWKVAKDLMTLVVRLSAWPAIRCAGFKGAVIFQKIGDAGRPEGVRRVVSRQPGLFEPPFKHVCGVGAHERPAR